METTTNWQYKSYVALRFFNGFVSFTSIMLNIVTIQALRKTTSVPKTLKTLLLSLAVSDLGVGLLVQPLFIATIQTNFMEQNSLTYTFKVLAINVFYYASFLGVTALGVDRFLAISLHLRYQELVTHKRVVAAVISIWLFITFLSSIVLWLPQKVRFFIYTTIEVVCLIATALLYFKIYLAVRKHRNQIQAVQVPQEGQSDENIGTARRRKSAVAAFYVYLVFLACYLPQNCIVVALASNIGGKQAQLIQHLLLYTMTLVFLNSSLNPLIYCWKMKPIRQAVINILRNIFSNNN